MSLVDDDLRAAGVGMADPGLRQRVRTELAVIASAVRDREARSVGLMPAAQDVAVPAVAVELAHALASAGASRVCVVDASASWPCAAKLVARAPRDDLPFATSWIVDNVAVITPRAPAARGVVSALSRILSLSKAFDGVIVDLTTLDVSGEHVAAYDLLDLVAIVARCGRTTVRQICKQLRDAPQDRELTVLLTGM